MTVCRFLVVAAVSYYALALSDTIPVIAWSAYSSSALDSLPSTFSNSVHSGLLLENILLQKDVCDHDAVILVQQPGLRASDLRSLSPDSHIARSLYTSVSKRQFPRVPSHTEFELSSIADRLSANCGSRLLQYPPGQGGITLEHDTKHVVCLDMPSLEETATARKDAVERHHSALAFELSALTSAFPDHLVVYTGAPLAKRQLTDATSLTQSPNFMANSTLPEGGIFKRYQLLTPGLITALLITIFVLVPIVMLGINALASIQSPLRVDSSKGFNAQEKKNQ